MGRFERKILIAITAVAVVPLVGALLLGRAALRDAYSVGVNRQVGAQLESGLSLYRAHFAALRADAERTADAVAHDMSLNRALARGVPADARPLVRTLDALVERYDNLSGLVVRAGAAEVAESSVPRDDASQRLLTLQRELPGVKGLRVEVTVGTAAAPFAEYQRAGEVAQVFQTLERGRGYVSNFYLAVYIALLLSVIAVALGVGIVLSRRVTRRVALLADATQQVGRGDLSVEVPTGDDDEVAELSRAFNRMVHDLSVSRERIDYLQRIGAWQQFARRLAHEIKNPLTPIQLAVQEAHKAYQGDDPRFRATLNDARTIVEEEVQTLRRLVGEFSEFARLPEVHLAEADLVELVRDAAQVARLEAEDQGDSIRLQTLLPDERVSVQVDAMLFKRCLDNLIRNAMQAIHAHARDGVGRVVVQVRSAARRLVVEVRDDGPGISDSDQSRAFDPYFTTKAEGTGLGLAIVKKIALEHRGFIEYDTAPEGGACFRIVLPRPGGPAVEPADEESVV